MKLTLLLLMLSLSGLFILLSIVIIAKLYKTNESIGIVKRKTLTINKTFIYTCNYFSLLLR